MNIEAEGDQKFAYHAQALMNPSYPQSLDQDKSFHSNADHVRNYSEFHEDTEGPFDYVNGNQQQQNQEMDSQIYQNDGYDQNHSLQMGHYHSQPNLYSGYMIDQRYGQMQQQPGISHQEFQGTVQRYEQVLQSLNTEFKNSLEQNRILQEQMANMHENQMRDQGVIEDMKRVIEIKEGEDNTQTLINEKNELRMQNESLVRTARDSENEKSQVNNQMLELKLTVDNLRNQVEEMKVTNASIHKVNDKYRENEYYIQQKYEEAREKHNEKDSLLRQKDEIIFGLSRNIDSLKADIRNMESVEDALKSEIDDLVGKRKALEDINQSLKNQVCEQNIEIRRICSENSNLNRENQTLLKNIDMFRKNTEDLMLENNKLKDTIDELEVICSDKEIETQQLMTSITSLQAEINRLRRTRSKSRETRSIQEFTPRKQSDDYDELNQSSNSHSQSFQIQNLKPVQQPQNSFQSHNFTPLKQNSFQRQNTKNLYQEYLNKMGVNTSIESQLQDISQRRPEAAQTQINNLEHSQAAEEASPPRRDGRNTTQSPFRQPHSNFPTTNSRNYEYMTPRKESHTSGHKNSGNASI